MRDKKETTMYSIYGFTDLPIPWDIGQADSIQEIIELIGYSCFGVITIIEN